MSTATSEQQQPARLSSMSSRPPEPEHLPCPRCDSTNTKFCYFNNYNLSQPRHFCKSCRRYWTRGGTLRNVPVGGGSRKSSAQKRPRTDSASGLTTPTSAVSSSSEIVVHEPQNQNLVHMVHQMGPGSDSGSMTGSFAACFDVNLNESVPETLSLSSLLTNHVGPGSFMPFGLGFGLDSGSGLNGAGFGLGSKWFDFPMESVCQASNDGGGGGGDGADGGGGGGDGGGNGGSPPGCNTWQMGGVEGGLGDDGDCFGWPDLAISMTGKGLK